MAENKKTGGLGIDYAIAKAAAAFGQGMTGTNYLDSFDKLEDARMKRDLLLKEKQGELKVAETLSKSEDPNIQALSESMANGEITLAQLSKGVQVLKKNQESDPAALFKAMVESGLIKGAVPSTPSKGKAVTPATIPSAIESPGSLWQEFDTRFRPGEFTPESITAGGVKLKDYGTQIAVKQAESDISVRAKAQEKAQKDLMAAQLQAQGTYRFMQTFDRSIAELRKDNPDIDKSGASGAISRIVASGKEKLSMYPETSAMLIRIQPMANKMARDIEGGKITDQDRQIYADSFANTLRNPSETNARLMSDSIINIIDSGSTNIFAQLKQFAQSSDPIFRTVIKQVLEQFPDKAKDIYGEDYEVVQ